MCIRVLGSRSAKLGDTVVAIVKESLPGISTQRGDIVLAVVVRTRKKILRFNGNQISFSQNAAILVNKDGNPRGSRVFGSVAREVRSRNFIKIISLAPEIVLFFVCPNA
jgi:large subunit ribosomal protein L14